MEELSARELAARLGDDEPVTLLDVREPWEVDAASIAGAVQIPLQQLPARYRELDSATPVAVLCHHGVRSAMAAQFLERQGFRTCNVTGGIDAWSLEVDPGVPRY